jgi:hypothetical protein
MGDLAAVHFPYVNASGCVRVLTNFYSVPLPVGLEVQVKVHRRTWRSGIRENAWHSTNAASSDNRESSSWSIYPEALTKKPGAFAGSTPPLEQRRAQGRWPASFDRFWEALKQRRGKQPGTRAMIDVLLLGRPYGYPSLKEALEKALDLSCFDVEPVRLLLTAERSGKLEPGEAAEIGALRA